MARTLLHYVITHNGGKGERSQGVQEEGVEEEKKKNMAGEKRERVCVCTFSKLLHEYVLLLYTIIFTFDFDSYQVSISLAKNVI